MKTAVEKLRERAEECLARAEDQAAAHLENIINGSDPEAMAAAKDMSVRTKASIALAGWHHARARTNIAAKSGPKLLGLIVMPGQIQDRKEWEQKARETDAKIIDTTAGPALLPPKDSE